MVAQAPGEGATVEVFRHCGPRHTDLEQTLAYARALDGRYNPAGEFGAIYVSASRDGAGRELDRRAEKLGLERSDLRGAMRPYASRHSAAVAAATPSFWTG